MEGNCEKLTYTHVISKGKTEEKHYGTCSTGTTIELCLQSPSIVAGIRLAAVSSMPKEVIDEAKELSTHIAEKSRVPTLRT